MSEPALVPGLIRAGTLLDGQVRYDQLAQGYRTGIEPVLLAASVPARPGQSVIEAGSGAGAALLCLACRVPDLRGLGIERDAALVALAQANARANLWQGRLTFQPGAIEHFAGDSRFDHAMANPPWHDEAGTRSPDPGRDGAKRATAGLLGAWTAALAACVRRRGTVSLILPAGQLDGAVVALGAAGCGALQLIPLWPKPGVPARLLIVRGVRGGRAPARLAAGLVLHEPAGGYSAAAEAILRRGGAVED